MLFRDEAIESKRSRITGNIIIIQPISIYISSLIAFLIIALVIIFLTQSEYSRKEKVKGYLIPEKGLVKVFSDRQGVVEELYVRESDHVTAGQPLVKVKNSQSLATGIELSDALSKEVSKQILTLQVELETSEQMFQNDRTRLKRQIVQLNQSLSSVQKAGTTNKKRLAIKEDQYLKNLKLFEKNYISNAQLSLIQEEYLEVLEINDRFEREMATIRVELSSLESDMESLPEKRLIKRALLERQISELKTKQFELENQYEFVKMAPESGVVTAIRPSLGMRINNQSPILSIIPMNSPLEIELLLPTRSAGFVQIGDSVKIRFDAFPYQKFGLVSGSIINVDKALILPTDKVLPIKIEEAMYRVRATLAQQSVTAYGKTFPLKVGMIADVDIILEKRTLLEWLLDPIYALKGQLG
ncbi:efflux RND transporter periplasmic adaptor subunit [Vibrio coralliilyticus]|uniref:efflux RND transporter periplasmic adaptor subunit n=1 Tax=Vibrio coralliilyticus TaxID=190893 RepID=UPI0018223334|nr:efflux RND transporter periplasmic adaptor subunit [Vibrio coralliilyticus]NUW70842.1 HlyD family efflux transporter periplasmic adaptor subunit [Vibrio coralliilyticus]